MDLPTIALSVRQPWAWAIIHGGKDIENRSAAAVRHGMEPGRICIHASKGMTQDEYDDTRAFMERIGVECPRPDELVRGAIIGAVTVVSVAKEHESPWFFGPRGLVLTDPVAVEPIPAAGQLGYFTWKRGNELDVPKPWMAAWPNHPAGRAPKAKAKPAMPLLEIGGA
ncbi:MAG: hypothetical protein HQL36_06425 [Alphaproteobacteria bacterium]|nr:hypothetical protein [Alphaproteobacteria bacterium]